MRTKLKITYSYFKIDDRAAVIKTVQCWVDNMIAKAGGTEQKQARCIGSCLIFNKGPETRSGCFSK